MRWSSTDGVSVCVGPEGNPQQQMQDTDLNSLFDADLELNHFAQGITLVASRDGHGLRRSGIRCSTFSGTMGED